MDYGRKLRIAWFSPLEASGGDDSVSTYCSRLLLPLLRERFDLELFHDSFEPYQDYATHHFLTAYRRHQTAPFDIFFYQLEDHKRSNFVRIHLGLIPGIVLFHDFVFRTDGPEPILNSPWQETTAKYRDRGRPWPARSREYKKESPLGLREAGYAAAALFSSPSMHAQFRDTVKQGLAGKPLSFYLPLPALEAELSHLEGTAKAIIFAGSPQIEHRAHKLLAALSEIRSPFQLRWLVSEAQERPAAELLEEFGISEAELVTGRSPERWHAMTAGADIAVHTLFSVYGQTGPYLEISLMAGLPVLVSDFAGAGYLPDDLVFKIEPGGTEAAEIKAVIEALLSGEVRVRAGRIRAYARELHDMRMVAAELSQVFVGLAPSISGVMRRWLELEMDARSSLLLELRELFPEGLLEGDEIWPPVCRPVFKELGWG